MSVFADQRKMRWGKPEAFGYRLVMRPLWYLILLLAVLAVGCPKPKPVVAPSPPPAPPRPPPQEQEAPAPPPILAPEVGREEENRQKQDAEAKIEGAEKLVKQIDQKRLAAEQPEIFLTIQSFLSKAREALSIGDFPRALNLAEKAEILAESLLSTPK